MRDAPTSLIEKYRVRRGDMATAPGLRYGKFIAPSPRGGKLVIIATDGIGASYPNEWEHVSVTSYDMRWKRRMPTWEEMCWVKDQFWSADEWVMQFHPAEEAYVNNVSNCLHLWRLGGFDMPTPDPALVGYRELGEIQ